MAIGIKDVARLAGVSPATVSRVLSGGIVSEKLQQRVCAVIEEIGYRPNLSARRLRAQKNDTIGLIIADIRNPFFTAFARKIDDEAQKNAQRVILCNTDENPEQELACLRLMEEENVAGVILAPTLSTLKNPQILPSRRPIMFIDRPPIQKIHDAVIIDNEEASAKLVNHLYGKGYKNILCLYGASSATGFEREKGYGKAVKKLGLPSFSIPVKHAIGEVERALQPLLSGIISPDALIVTNGVLALKVASLLLKEKIQVPDHLALACFDDEPWMQLIFNGITTIAQPIKQIAELAHKGLTRRMRETKNPINHVVLKGKLIIRGSTQNIKDKHPRPYDLKIL
ncbi:LacI family DNA-binding transcriptional regulator [Bartonella tamiae]|uniref:HTH lacI-type domain-containing protein n=1 Tax=Bartonella tamiae Th239 TaxID=1094558 RepID=J0ZLH5_9HYPH|nr:LacI family DNA-binding transcriptional regulator [Bartonella tamiae]EJF89263.1 hypothetical protein ME5_01814 [Bartonella tamiae Th239]EJF95575.1 hypothetical protein MEG_00065 [Bartonella tamiae Th307]